MTPAYKIAHTQIIVTEFSDGEAVLIDVRRKNYYQLNETALLIWRGLENQLSCKELAQQLLVNFDVTLEQAHDNILALFNDFQARNLILPA